MMPPPAPLPPPDDDPWDEFDTAPAPVVAPPMPGPPVQTGALPTPPPPAETMLPAVPVSTPQAVAAPVAPAVAAAQAVIPQQAAGVVPAQPTTTNLGGQQVMMQAGMMPAQAATVVQVPVPVVKEPREWPPLTHMIVMAGFGLLLFTAVLLLFANLADPPAVGDFGTDADDLEDFAEALDKYDRRQAVYGAFSLFFATVGQMAVAAGLLLYTVKDGEDMPVPVRAVLLGGVLLLLTRMMTGGLDLAALL